MDAPIRYEASQEPLEVEERERMDPDNWDWDNPIEVVVAENPRVSFEIAITFEEQKRVAEAARSRGLNASGIIQKAALDAAQPRTPLTRGGVNHQTRERRSG